MKKKNKWSTFVLLLIFFIGFSVTLYPTISEYWNSRSQSKAITDYEKIIENLPEKDYTKIFDDADAFNKTLAGMDFPLLDYKEAGNYRELLDISGTGMMGYITIDVIGVELAIYHGTEDDVMSHAAGHLEGSSFPIGGESTHSVISAHRGLSSAALFTNLDHLELGDTFEITILDRVLTYQVDNIEIVDPDDTSLLRIENGKDRCTLLTCTPYGINTHRLLVQGTRIETIAQKTIYVTSDAHQIEPLIVTPIVALPILLVLMLIVLFKPIKKDDMGDDFE